MKYKNTWIVVADGTRAQIYSSNLRSGDEDSILSFLALSMELASAACAGDTSDAWTAVKGFLTRHPTVEAYYQPVTAEFPEAPTRADVERLLQSVPYL